MTLVSFAKHNIRPWEMGLLLYDDYLTFKQTFRQGVS